VRFFDTLSNAPYPIEITLDGIVMEESEMQFLKANQSSFSIPLDITTLFMVLEDNASVPMAYT